MADARKGYLSFGHLISTENGGVPTASRSHSAQHGATPNNFVAVATMDGRRATPQGGSNNPTPTSPMESP